MSDGGGGFSCDGGGCHVGGDTGGFHTDGGASHAGGGHVDGSGLHVDTGTHGHAPAHGVPHHQPHPVGDVLDYYVPITTETDPAATRASPKNARASEASPAVRTAINIATAGVGVVLAVDGWKRLHEEDKSASGPSADTSPRKRGSRLGGLAECCVGVGLLTTGLSR